MVPSQPLYSLVPIFCLSAILFAGCTSNYPARPYPPATQGDTSGANGTIDHSQDADPAVINTPRLNASGATLALLEDSGRARAAGDFPSALAYVERAIRLDPRRADLWIELGEIELDRNQPDQAERYARKALSLAGQRIDWQRDAWLLIANAHSARGDEAQASAIRARWQTYRG